MRSYPLTIAAGQSEILNVPFSEVVFCDASSVDTFLVKIGNDAEIDFFNGRRYRSRTPFNVVEIENPNGTSMTINLLIGDAEIDDQRFSVSGSLGVKNDATDDELNVQTKAGTVLKVDDDETQTALATLNTSVANVQTAVDNIETLLQSDTDLRSPLTDLTNATDALVTNATTTLVTAGANTNGILLRLGMVSFSADATTKTGYLSIGGNYIIYHQASSQLAKVEQVRDILLPAGQALVASASNASTYVSAWYEVL